jgi:NADH/NAD ratio-sensing transcriptional regulator Rex
MIKNMKNNILTIMEDKREIRRVIKNNEIITVGWDEIKRIVPYYENGQMEHIVWLAIYDKNDVIISRMDSANTIIVYEENQVYQEIKKHDKYFVDYGYS